MSWPARVRIVEVGPRDGLQNEGTPLPTARKIAFIEALVEAGLEEIEATSFVHPRAVPQLADAEEVAAHLPKAPGVRFSALVPNERGLDRALAAGIERIAVFTAASETFCRRNINMGREESLEGFAAIVERALAEGLSARGYISTAFVCPYEGEIEPRTVRDVAEALIEMGCDEVAICDTLGVAVPSEVEALVELVAESVPRKRLALHLHDTSGTALANVCAAMRIGIATFDSAAGGLGGCPYAPGAAGNLATEDLVYLLDRLGIECGVALEGVFGASCLLEDALGRRLPGRQYQRLRSTCAPPPEP